MIRKLDAYLCGTLVAALVVHYVSFIPEAADNAVLLVLSVAGTVPVLASAFASLRNRKISVDLLASIALVASLLTAQWASAAFINLMLTSARLFGYYTETKARAAIKSLLKLRPEIVKVKKGSQIAETPVARVAVGDLVVVESGDRLAVDGVVEEGEASVDQSSLTGESVPVAKAKGNEVFSSTLAVSGSLIVRATKVGSDTTLERIIGMVESSQNEKARIRTAADKFSSWYIGATLIGSVSVYILFHDLNFLLSLLLVACADDIAVAIPMAFLAAIGYAARRGVIVKGGAYLEGLSAIKTLVVDKTGTVTRGAMAVEKVTAMDGMRQRELLRVAGVAESVSEHPIAKSIVRYVEEAGVKFEEPEKFREFPGKGITAISRGKEIVAGNESFLKENKVRVSERETALTRKAQEGGFTVTLIASGRKLAGFFSSADEVRPHVKAAMQRVRELGVEKVVMLTGDNERVAKKIADEVGVTEYHAALLPEDKLAYLKRSIVGGQKLAMVGDGVNDAASLALADVGIAMGAIGSDAAIEASDIALMKDDFREVPETMELGRYTQKIARQDFWIWGITNATGVILVALRFLGPEGSAAFNFVTDFFPLLNSLRLFNLHLKLR